MHRERKICYKEFAYGIMEAGQSDPVGEARRLEPQGSPKEEPVLQIVAGGLFPREGQSCLYACLPLVA